MKLYCRVCKKHYDLNSGKLICTGHGNEHHVLEKQVDKADLRGASEYWGRFAGDKNPYIIFREVLSSWHLSAQVDAKLNSTDWNKTLQTIDAQAGRVFNCSLAITPLLNTTKLCNRINMQSNTLYIKNETKNLSGSHKSRHNVALLLYFLTQNKNTQPLAIFSCGNAALGAAAIAYSANLPLYTFVPEGVNSVISQSLLACGATVVKVKRDNVGHGDPCNNRYKEALNTLKFTPFSCYAYDLWPSTEGIEVLALEYCLQIAEHQQQKQAQLDNVIVQVGGAGLAHGVLRGLKLATQIGLLNAMPKLFLVQTEQCYPLLLSYIKVLKHMAKALMGEIPEWLTVNNAKQISLCTNLRHLELRIKAEFNSAAIQNALFEIEQQRDVFFSPWPHEVYESIAEGIMDDTTYDGFEVISGLLETGGTVRVLSETQLQQAVDVAQEHVEPNVSATGTAGLAGLLQLRTENIINNTSITAIIFTGVEHRDTINTTGVQGRVVNLSSDMPITAILG